jgi:alanine-glyoxylate transaminase/serine-glyoxylate transaminase/serine-pyruvate transaminase
VWRIGLMGFASNKNNVLLCVSALGNVLAAQGIQTDVSKAVSSAQAVYSV